MIPPSVAQAASDPAVTDVASRMLVVLSHELLDIHAYRPLKHELVRLRVRRKRQTIAFALDQLVRLGYLQCGARDPQAPLEARSERPLWYRLIWSREELAHRPPWSMRA